MNTDVLRRFREGVAAKRFTLTRLAEVAEVPLATLSDWSDPKRQPKAFEKLERLEAALDQIESETANQGEGAPTAA